MHMTLYNVNVILFYWPFLTLKVTSGGKHMRWTVNPRTVYPHGNLDAKCQQGLILCSRLHKLKGKVLLPLQLSPVLLAKRVSGSPKWGLSVHDVQMKSYQRLTFFGDQPVFSFGWIFKDLDSFLFAKSVKACAEKNMDTAIADFWICKSSFLAVPLSCCSMQMRTLNFPDLHTCSWRKGGDLLKTREVAL